ncbi:MAG: alpha/beta hydrolase [Thermodesulfobacteriota bacterium]
MSLKIMLAFLCSNYSGLIIAMAVNAAGVILYAAANNTENKAWALAAQSGGICLMILGLILSVGAIYHLYKLYRARSLYPPPGRMIDVGGYRMHIIAEGDAKDSPAVVWVSGRHEQGFVLNHLHKIMAKETRSILFDRPGSGWSDTGSFPRTVEQEAVELHFLLQRAGETGPYILVPWSFGGPLSVTFADMFPDDTAGLVLLDITSAAYPVFDRDLGIRSMCRKETLLAWLSRFGIMWNWFLFIPKKEQEKYKKLYHAIADVQDAMFAKEAEPRYYYTTRSALYNAAIRPAGTAQGHGVLGNLPLFVIIPHQSDKEILRVAKKIYKTEYEQKNFIRFANKDRSDLMELSTKGEIHIAPKGSTHSFPFEEPQYVLNQVREMITLIRSNS